MSDKSSAIEFLAEIQEECIRHGGITPLGLTYTFVQKPEFSINIFKDTRKKLKEKGYHLAPNGYSELIAEIEKVKHEYSPHEHIINISIIETIKQSLKKAFAERKLLFPDNVIIGTAQFGQLNARVTTPSVESNIRVVLFDDGLFIFLNSLSKIVSTLFEKRTEINNGYSLSFHRKDIEHNLNTNNEIHNQFVDLITTYLVTGHSAYSKAFTIDYEHNHFAGILRHTSELFILAHEYGHIINGHLSETPNELKEFYEDLKLETWQIAWQQEKEADFFACIMVMCYNHHIEDMTAEASFAGISFLFAAFEILSVIMGYKPSLTHPAPGERYTYLLETLYEDTDDKDLVDSVKNLGKSIGFAIRNLYFKNRETIKKIIQEAKDKNS